MDQLMAQLDIQRLVTLAVEFIPRLVVALIILSAFWILFAATRGPMKALLARAGLHGTLVRMIVDNVYKFTVLLFGLVMAADQVGVNVGAALAGLGVAGIAVGFAAQDTLANIIAGFLIFLDKPFAVGEWVNVAGQYGEVSSITMRTTRIRTNNNTYVVIPNKKIIDEVLVNHSKHGETRVDVPVGIAYKESVPKAREVILRALGEMDGVLKSPAADVVVTELGGSSVNLDVRVWISNASRERPTYFHARASSWATCSRSRRPRSASVCARKDGSTCAPARRRASISRRRCAPRAACA
jgi:small conductance mechanosensitive channel